MGQLKIRYSDKKVTPFGGMKLLKDFMETTNIIDDLRSVNLPYPQSNAGIDPIDIIQGFWLSIFTGASRYIVTPQVNPTKLPLSKITKHQKSQKFLYLLPQISPL